MIKEGYLNENKSFCFKKAQKLIKIMKGFGNEKDYHIRKLPDEIVFDIKIKKDKYQNY